MIVQQFIQNHGLVGVINTSYLKMFFKILIVSPLKCQFSGKIMTTQSKEVNNLRPLMQYPLSFSKAMSCMGRGDMWQRTMLTHAFQYIYR